MKSIYDEIKTAADLVNHVSLHGLSTKEEDISRAWDIIGHSTIEELDTLANDIGRNNENGEPDPNGSWSSGRKATRDTFYFILFKIWNYEDAVRFWNEHTNPEHNQLIAIKEMNAANNKKVAELQEQVESEHKSRLEETKLAIEAEEKARRLQSELHDRDMTIMELKAKLYDLMEEVKSHETA